MISSGLNVIITQTRTGTEFTLQLHSSNVGVAHVSIQPDMVNLHWIEIKLAHQRKGLGSFLLNYIIENCLASDSMLKISAVDEETLEFYFNCFKKRGLHCDDINHYVVDGDIFPMIVIPASVLNRHDTKNRRTM